MKARFNSWLPLAACSLATVAIASGCGTGKDPLDILGNPAKTPELALPVSTLSTATSITPFNSTNKDFGFLQTNYFSGGTTPTILAPAQGVVTKIDSVTESNVQYYSITIAHNIHISTVLSRVAFPTRKVGDFVNQGDPVSSAVSVQNFSVVARFAVFVDGEVVCPLSFMSSAARQSISNSFALFGNQLPCQI